MAKKKKLEKKKRRRVRPKDWENTHEDSFTHDLVKHRRATVKLSESAQESNPLPADFECNGLVISHSKKWAFVMMGDEERLCIIDERMKEDGATLLAPGDNVYIEFEEGEAIVRGVGERRTKLSRPGGTDARLGEQILAANLDLLIVVAAAADPPFRPGLVDRYLIAAQRGGIKPVLCINKMDLVSEPPAEIDAYRDLGIDIVFTSCEDESGLVDLREMLHGKLAVLSGHSGVGKSSLLNAIEPNLELHTQAVSGATNKGKHTTSASRLYTLGDAIRIIDTPGIRALGLIGVSPEEVAWYFPEIAEAAVGCRFRDCTHTHEPRCGVQDALQSGDLNQGRFDSYLRIRASLESHNNTTPGRLAPHWTGEEHPKL